MTTRRQLLTALTATGATALAGCTSTENNTKTTSNDSNGSTPDQSEETLQEETPGQEPEEQKTEGEQTFNIETPVDAPFYDQALQEVNPRQAPGWEAVADTLEGTNSPNQQAAALANLEIDGETYDLHQIAYTLHKHTEDIQEETDIQVAPLVLSQAEGQLNADNRTYNIVRYLENGDLQNGALHGQAYNGTETHNYAQPNQSSSSMNRLLTEHFSGLSLAHHTEAMEDRIEGLEESSRLSEGQIERGKKNVYEEVSKEWSASMLGDTGGLQLRAVNKEDMALWEDSAFGDINYNALAGKLQNQYKDSEYHNNGQWTGYEVTETGTGFDIEFTNDIEVDAAF